MLALALFEPSLPYKVTEVPADPLDSEGFRRLLASLAGSHSHSDCRVDVLTNGEVFYEAELQAIREARHSVNLEAYIFAKGQVTHRFLEAMTERAKAGVHCNVVLDAVGAFTTWQSYFAEFREAGGRVYFYHPLKLVHAAAHQQPHAPRADRGGRPRRVPGRGGLCGPLDAHARPQAEAALAGHDVPGRGAHRARPAVRVRRELARVLWRAAHGAGLLPAAVGLRTHVGHGRVQHPHDRPVGAQPHGLPDAPGGRAAHDRDHHALLPARPQRVHGDGARDPGAGRGRHHPHAWPALATTC